MNLSNRLSTCHYEHIQITPWKYEFEHQMLIITQHLQNFKNLQVLYYI